nr:MAG TPA: hypothetical protein [Herelleviridae sp.]
MQARLRPSKRRYGRRIVYNILYIVIKPFWYV